jgi:hypothetical protein
MNGWGETGVGIDASGGRFDAKLAASNDTLYSVGDAEQKDLSYMVENSCISCNRLLKRGEVKIIPPRYIQDRDEYVRSGAVTRRLMCVQCYNALKTVTKSKVRVKDTPADRKGWFVRAVVENLLLKS